MIIHSISTYVSIDGNPKKYKKPPGFLTLLFQHTRSFFSRHRPKHIHCELTQDKAVLTS